MLDDLIQLAPADWQLARALMKWSILGMMGQELVERRMLKKRPGYEDYVRRTSGFFPWPPRR